MDTEDIFDSIRIVVIYFTFFLTYLVIFYIFCKAFKLTSKQTKLVIQIFFFLVFIFIEVI